MFLSSNILGNQPNKHESIRCIILACKVIHRPLRGIRTSVIQTITPLLHVILHGKEFILLIQMSHLCNLIQIYRPNYESFKYLTQLHLLAQPRLPTRYWTS